VIAPKRHVQSRCPESSTAGRVPRGTRLDLDGFLDLIDADYGGVHLPPLFYFLLKLVLVAFVSFSGCATWLLIREPHFFQ
jgi:hypothetical protein